MAKRKSDKQKAKLLIKTGIILYIFIILVTCHIVKIDYSDIDNLLENLLLHIITHPFDIFPLNWEALGSVSFIFFLCAAGVNVSYLKQKQTRPGEEGGTAQWNDDYDKFSIKYSEPFGSKEISQKSGWIDKATGRPWKEIKTSKEEKTKSFVVAITRLFKGRVEGFKKSKSEKWLDFKDKFRKDVFSIGDEEFKEPTEIQKKIFSFVCNMENKLDMNLDRFKPRVCLKLAEEEEKRIERMLAENIKRQKPVQVPQAQKLVPTLIPQNRNMILSKNVALSMDGRKTWKNNNALIIGGSGSGKTRFYLKPNLMQLNCSYVITDPSGEILECYGKFLQNMGYKLKVINLTEMDHSDCYNPFNYVREDSDILVMVDVLTKNLTPPDSHSSDPFWQKAQAALLQAICFLLYKEYPPADRNFTNVMKLLRIAVVTDGENKSQSPLDVIMADLEKENPNHIAVMQYAIFKQAPTKTATTILTCAQVDLGPFNLEVIANLTGKDTIDMGTIGLEPTALFCITPTAKTTYNWIISLAYTQLFETLYHTAETRCVGKRLPVPVRFLLDEFANIGQIPDFPQKLSTMRKYGISCDIIIQNMAQLETMYKNDWKTIVGNCDTFIYLGGHESSSTEYVSKMLGKQTIKSRNSSRTYGRQGSSNISYNAQGRELMTPDEIAHMSDQKCLVMVKGLMPFFDYKYDIKKHPNFRFTGDWEDENHNTPPELIFNIAEEIQTPNSNPFGNDKERSYKELQNEARAETSYYNRENMPVRRRRSDLELNKKNFEEAGFDNLFNQNEDDEPKNEIEIVGANYPEGEFTLDSDVVEQNEEAFDDFLDE